MNQKKPDLFVLMNFLGLGHDGNVVLNFIHKIYNIANFERGNGRVCICETRQSRVCGGY